MTGLTFSGIVGAMLVGIYLDRTKQFSTAIKVSFLTVNIGLVVFMAVSVIARSLFVHRGEPGEGRLWTKEKILNPKIFKKKLKLTTKIFQNKILVTKMHFLSVDPHP